jgi:hypothetical protein
MGKPFIRVRYDRMHNQDFIWLCENLIETIPNFELKTLQLEDAFLNFERKVTPLLENLLKKQRKLPQSASIDNLRKRMEDIVSALLLYVKSLQRVEFTEQKEYINLCGPLIRKKLKDYVHESLPSRTTLLNSIFNIAEQKPEYQQAYDALGINRFLQEITATQQQIKEMETERTTHILKQPRPGTTTVAKEQIISELKLLLMIIELSANTNNEADYLPLISMINVYLIDARAQLRNLASRRKTRKAKAEKKLEE